MDQSKSNSVQAQELPRRTFTLEFVVGVFTIIGVAAVGYLAIGLGGIELGTSDKYQIYAEFDNVSGLQYGASVEIAGVQVGEVSGITLKDDVALITLKISRKIKIRDDDVASVRTKGIIGDKYIKISRGASDDYINENETIVDTESVVDFEDIIGKIVHSFESSSKSGE